MSGSQLVAEMFGEVDGGDPYAKADSHSVRCASQLLIWLADDCASGGAHSSFGASVWLAIAHLQPRATETQPRSIPLRGSKAARCASSAEFGRCSRSRT